MLSKQEVYLATAKQSYSPISFDQLLGGYFH